jgi:hypothetical protein
MKTFAAPFFPAHFNCFHFFSSNGGLDRTPKNVLRTDSFIWFR